MAFYFRTYCLHTSITDIHYIHTSGKNFTFRDYSTLKIVDKYHEVYEIENNDSITLKNRGQTVRQMNITMLNRPSTVIPFERKNTEKNRYFHDYALKSRTTLS